MPLNRNDFNKQKELAKSNKKIEIQQEIHVVYRKNDILIVTWKIEGLSYF